MTEQITYKENKTDFITHGDISKVIMKLSIPLMISNLIKTFYGIVDGVYVAQLSAEDYAATAFIWPLQYLFIAFGLGISIAATSMMSQKLGAGKRNEAKVYANHAMVISILMGLVFSFLLYAIAPTALS